jgi:hypothetical protein
VARNRNRRVDVSLPKRKSLVSTLMESYTWLIYGRKKIGKTSLTARFNGQLHMMFEAGAKALSLYKVDIPAQGGWKHAREYRDQLVAGGHDFKNVVIDVGPTAYDRCLEWVCSDMGIKHPSDESWGKGWKAVSDEFKKFHLDLLAADLGLVVLAHDHIREVTPEGRETFNQIYPKMASGAEDFYSGVIDIIAYYRYVGRDRWLQIRGDDYVLAGCRCEQNFLTPSGQRVVNVPMGDSADEAYENLAKAFNNEQRDTYADIGGKAKSLEEEEAEAELPRRKTRVLSRKGR